MDKIIFRYLYSTIHNKEPYLFFTILYLELIYKNSELDMFFNLEIECTIKYSMLFKIKF